MKFPSTRRTAPGPGRRHGPAGRLLHRPATRLLGAGPARRVFGIHGSPAGPRASSRSPRPIRWPPMRATRCSRPEVRPSTRPSRCRWCSRWSNPSPAASAAAPSCCMPRAARWKRTTGAKPPRRRQRNLFLGRDGKPVPFYDGVVGGRSVGVPGAVRMLEMAHREYGGAALGTTVRARHPAGRRRLQGERPAPQPARQRKYLAQDPAARAYFFDPAGKPWPVGHVLRNPELAAVLRAIAQNGSRALLEGEVAQAIVAKVQGHPTNPGQLSLADLAGYQPKKREALCSDYAVAAHAYRMCGFPPPGSGAIAVAQILGILQQTPAAGMPLQAGRTGPRTCSPAPTGSTTTTGRAPGLRRPRALRGRSGLRAAAGGQLVEPGGPPPIWRSARASSARRA